MPKRAAKFAKSKLQGTIHRVIQQNDGREEWWIGRHRMTETKVSKE